MLYSYAGFPERSFAIFEGPLPEKLPVAVHPEDVTGSPREINISSTDGLMTHQSRIVPQPSEVTSSPADNIYTIRRSSSPKYTLPITPPLAADTVTSRDSERDLRVKQNMMSGLSIVLTLMSIIVAFRFVGTVFSSSRLAIIVLQHSDNNSHGPNWREL